MNSTQSAASKRQILDAGGYRYNFDRQIYFHRGTKKAFSVEFLQDHSEDEISRLIQDGSASPEWRFFFNKKPSASVEKELASVLG